MTQCKLKHLSWILSRVAHFKSLFIYRTALVLKHTHNSNYVIQMRITMTVKLNEHSKVIESVNLQAYTIGYIIGLYII